MSTHDSKPPMADVVTAAAPRPGDALVMIKSHVFADCSQNTPALIMEHLVEVGFQIIATRVDVTMDAIEAIYADHRGKDYHSRLIASVSGPVIAFWVRHQMITTPERAIKLLVSTCGATRPEDADPDSIRGKFSGATLPWNAVHRSDSVATGIAELGHVFA